MYQELHFLSVRFYYGIFRDNVHFKLSWFQLYTIINDALLWFKSPHTYHCIIENSFTKDKECKEPDQTRHYKSMTKLKCHYTNGADILQQLRQRTCAVINARIPPHNLVRCVFKKSNIF